MKKFEIPKPTEQVIPQVENFSKSVLLIGLLIDSFALTQVGVAAIDAYLSYQSRTLPFVVKWAVVINFAVLNCILLIGIAVMAHESIHWVLFKNRFWNDLWGGILSSLVGMLPFYANRQFHLTHHCYTHQLGLDPEESLHNHPFWYALMMGGLIAFYQHYKIVATNLLAFFSGKWNKGYRGLKDVCFVALAVTFYFYLLPLVGISLRYTVVPTFVFLPLIYSFRALCDHYAFPPALSSVAWKSFNQEVDTEDKRQNIQGKQLPLNSWVILTNPLLTWLWSNVNYHQIHHRYPYLSHRYLAQIFEATKQNQPDAVVNGYFRCLVLLSKMKYYSNQEEIEHFLLEVISGSST